VHPAAIAAGRRHGLDLTGAIPHPLDDSHRQSTIVTVCDRAHEQLDPSADNWHWSIPDPVDIGTDDAFDDAVTQLDSRIRTLTWTEPTLMTDTADATRNLNKPTVLFLCVHNAGRSQMAAGWLRHLAGDTVEVFSGGSHPGTGTNKTAITAMAEVGIDIASEYPKPWTDEIARAADVIVSMGCGDACPIFPGKRYEDWELDDPSNQPLDTVRHIRDDIRTRVETLIASLHPATA
jgi:protein-tyrosine-phosphatase